MRKIIFYILFLMTIVVTKAQKRLAIIFMIGYGAFSDSYEFFV